MSGQRRFLAGFSVAVLVWAAALPALAQTYQGERDRRAPRAVKNTAFSLLVPIYDHTTLSNGGWTDQPRTLQNRLAVVASLVSPMGRNWGWRASIGGGWSKFERDPDTPVVIDEKVGDFLVGGGFFRRNPNTGATGINYIYRGRSTDTTNGNRRNRLTVFGDLYVDDFDFGVELGYGFGSVEGEDWLESGNPMEGIDRDYDGFVFDIDARWYANDRWSAVLGLQLDVSNVKAQSGGVTQLNAETTSVGPVLKLAWLPPLGAKSWLSVEGTFSYLRVKGSVATGTYPDDGDVNQFGAGAVVKVQLPRVESLKELIRQY